MEGSSVPKSMAEVVSKRGAEAKADAKAAELREKSAASAAAAQEKERKAERKRAQDALDAAAKMEQARKKREEELAEKEKERKDAAFTYACLKELYPKADIEVKGKTTSAYKAAIDEFEVYEMMSKKPEQLHLFIGASLMGYEQLCESTQKDILDLYAKGLGVTFRDHPNMQAQMKPHYQRLIMAYPQWFRFGLPPVLEFGIALAGAVKNLSTALRQAQSQTVHEFARPTSEGPVPTSDGDTFDDL